MADNITLPAISGTIAADEISTVKYQRIKLIHGVDGVNSGDVAAANPLPVAQSRNGSINKSLYQFMSDDGVGTGLTNPIGDYSTVQKILYIQPGAGQIFRITRMLINVRDDTTTQWERYGGISGLTTGIQVRVQDNSGTLLDLTAGERVKSNAVWGEHCYDADIKTAGSGDDFFQARWTFKNAGQPLRLVGDNNERLELLLDDNFTGLVTNCFKIDGEIENTA